MKLFHRSNEFLSDIYFAIGKTYFRHQVPQVRDDDLDSSPGGTDDKNEGFEEAWFNFLTAASLGHK